MYTTKDVVEKTNISASAVRKYSSLLEQNNHTFTKKSEQRYYFNKDIYLLRKIHKMYTETDLSLEEIIPLSLQEEESSPVQTPVQHEVLIASQNEKFEKFMDVIETLSKQNEEIIQVNQHLLEAKEKTEEQLHYIHTKLEQQERSRDIQLMTVIREMQEAKKIVAATKEPSLIHKVRVKFGL